MPLLTIEESLSFGVVLFGVYMLSETSNTIKDFLYGENESKGTQTGWDDDADSFESGSISEEETISSKLDKIAGLF